VELTGFPGNLEPQPGSTGEGSSLLNEEDAPAAMTAIFSERDFSGGVFLPVMVGDEIYYRGAFATWDALMKFPEKAHSLSGLRVPLRLRPWDDDERQAIARP